MNKIVKTVTCDLCEKEVERQVTPHKAGAVNRNLDGWVLGSRAPHTELYPAIELDFCSPLCASKYFASLAGVNND